MSAGSVLMWAMHPQRMFDHPGISASELIILMALKGVTLEEIIARQTPMNTSETALRSGVIRVSINTDGTYDILDFTLPSLGDRAKKGVPQEDMPEWISNALAILQIAETHTVIDGVGYRLPNLVFYLLEPTQVMKGETDEPRPQSGKATKGVALSHMEGQAVQDATAQATQASVSRGTVLKGGNHE